MGSEISDKVQNSSSLLLSRERVEMKKSFALVLSLVIMAFVLSACGAPADAGGEVLAAVTFSDLDLPGMISAALSGSGIFVVIFGLVELIREVGIRDRALLVTSMMIGLLLGLGYLIAAVGQPADFGAWFAYAIVGLLYGLIASGVVKLANRVASQSTT